MGRFSSRSRPKGGMGAHGGTGPPVRADLPRRGRTFRRRSSALRGSQRGSPFGRFFVPFWPLGGLGACRLKAPLREGGAACRRQAGGFHFQPEGLAARRLALKVCKMTPTGTPTTGRGKCRHTYFLSSCLAAFAGGT